MEYDCSVSNRKGCNYCNSYKTFYNAGTDMFFIDGYSKTLGVRSNGSGIIEIEINYCPICGKKLRRQVL